MRYRFFKEHRGELGPIRKACKTLRVSKYGLCGILSRRKSSAQIEREALESFVADILEEHRHRYGYRRINRELGKTGITVSDKRVLNVMRKPDLRAKGATRRWRPQRQHQPGDPRLNLVEQVFTVPERNRLWVGDITYMPTGEGWLYLATGIDAWSRKIVGWSMSSRITENLATDAIN